MKIEDLWYRFRLGASLFELRPHRSPSATTRHVALSFLLNR
ncbi:hypothetical protein D1AOALGA4SA_7650 [Olavius algarvensis Delta 1 endosymbiont]|nr:hypothetical protein D1AOALGA4SA_7650 [Olavius algarvensis Delta 1 endosymbiont]